MPMPLSRKALIGSMLLTSLMTLTSCASVPANIQNPVFLKNDISDRQIDDKANEPKPIVRIPPILPLNFMKGNYSGECGLIFDISASGIPVNVEAEYCTHDALEASAIDSIHKWKYAGRAAGGNDIIFYGSKTKIRFLLTDKSTNVFPYANSDKIPPRDP